MALLQAPKNRHFSALWMLMVSCGQGLKGRRNAGATRLQFKAAGTASLFGRSPKKIALSYTVYRKIRVRFLLKKLQDRGHEVNLSLLMPFGCLVAVDIMHRLTVKLGAVFRWSSAARWERPVVTLTIVELVIDVAVEVIRSVIPRANADEDTAAAEPLRPIIAIRSAVVRRSLVVPVGTNGRFSDTDCNLCMCFLSGSKQKTCSNRH
jgi:hypothetical protein